MSKRPKLTLTLTKTDVVLETVGWLLLVAMWVIAALSYGNLPDTIPTHYNLNGKADAFGSKNNLFIMPVVATLMLVGMTYLNKFPHIFNYMEEITESNAERQYKAATGMIRLLKVSIAFTFTFIVFKMSQSASGNEDNLGIWFLPFIFLLFIIPIGYFMFKNAKQ